MVCHPFQAAGNQTEAAYRRRITGEGPTYRERQEGRVHFRECREDMAAVSMASHMMTLNGQVVEAQRIWITLATGDGSQTYRMDFLAKGGPRRYPVEVCPVQAAKRTEMWVYFLHRHVLDTVVILEEGNPPYPRCNQCEILVYRRALNGRHPTTDQCARGAERKMCRLAETELRESL